MDWNNCITKHTAVCKRHFEENAFISTDQNLTTRGKVKKRRALKPTAVPTLFMSRNDDDYRQEFLQKWAEYSE